MPHPERKLVYHHMAMTSAARSIQRVFLSGTQPPYLHTTFCKLVFSEHLRTIRASTDRPELSYQVVSIPMTSSSQDLMEYTMRLSYALEKLLNDDERMIVFFEDVKSAEFFAEKTVSAIYHSKLAPGNPQELNLTLWDKGARRVMASTTGLSQGIDREKVKFVIIHNSTYGLMTYGQQVGRAGRNGKPAFTFLVRVANTTLVTRYAFHSPDDHSAYTPWSYFTANKSECRRKKLLHTMDGWSHSCSDNPTCNPCDICNPEGEMAVFAREAVLHKVPPRHLRSLGLPFHPMAPSQPYSDMLQRPTPPQRPPVASTSHIASQAVTRTLLADLGSDGFDFEPILYTPSLGQELDKIATSYLDSVSRSYFTCRVT
jgi:superfamily II DNA helicase RecQ